MPRINCFLHGLALLMGICMGSNISAQTTLAYWNFNQPPENGQNWAAALPADIGNGRLTHTFEEVVSYAGTTINGLSGETNGGSFCPRGGSELCNNQRWLQVQVSDVEAKTLLLTYVTRRTSTGFSRQQIMYSLDDGASWNLEREVDLSDFSNSWVYRQVVEVPFTQSAALPSGNDFLIRIVVDGAARSDGNTRIDNLHLQVLEALSTTSDVINSETTYFFYNPFDEVLEPIGLSGGPFGLCIYDGLGRLRFQGEISQGAAVSMRGLRAGLYFVVLQHRDGSKTSSKFFVK
ncbi:MAG TPA: T9SS type A sorting domain-containing protein [Bacteroidales bacterium]|nr:T9SS type A sorting domain-containing protein [Bacteroidales bacterium]